MCIAPALTGIPPPFAAIMPPLISRAIERVIASDKMTAFSNPADRIGSNETGADKGDKSAVRVGHSQSRVLAASTTPEEEAFVSASCSPGSSGGGSDLPGASETRELSRGSHDGTEPWLQFTGASTTTSASAAFPLQPICCHSETELGENRGASSDADAVRGGKFCFVGGLAASHEALPMNPQGLSEGAMEEMHGQDIAEADWLDVSHALLDAVNEHGRTCGD